MKEVKDHILPSLLPEACDFLTSIIEDDLLEACILLLLSDIVDALTIEYSGSFSGINPIGVLE